VAFGVRLGAFDLFFIGAVRLTSSFVCGNRESRAASAALLMHSQSMAALQIWAVYWNVLGVFWFAKKQHV
jgi:hypothetical protein